MHHSSLKSQAAGRCVGVRIIQDNVIHCAEVKPQVRKFRTCLCEIEIVLLPIDVVIHNRASPTSTAVCYNERNKKEAHIRVIAGRGHGIAYMFCDDSIVSSVRWSSNGC
jgi:hypothetical protein